MKRSIKKFVAFVLALAFSLQIISFAPYNSVLADEDPYDYYEDYYDYEDTSTYDERGF